MLRNATFLNVETTMKIGMYSVTYRGVWYRGEPVDIFHLVRLAEQQGWEGVELGRGAAPCCADGPLSRR